MASIDSIVSQYAASDPTVAAAVDTQQTDSAILTGIQAGDPGTSSLLTAVYSQGQEINTLLNSAAAVTSGTQSSPTAIGGNLDIHV
jgi:hypothetical protein